ncbi:hypothetical protein PF003_g10766 [Phytophthora fragariae]|nr:hypothetical protein PF003_g10766 [Phytophthora fragariae]
MEDPILLLWDDFSGHWSPDVVSYASKINVHLMKVPPSATSVAQPADAIWNRPFRTALRNMWIAHLREELAAHATGDAFKLKAPDRRSICNWISDA